MLDCIVIYKIHSSSMAVRQHAAERKESRGLVEQFEPSSAWTEDSNCHYLLLDLPGFKKEWLRLHIDDNGEIVVNGERHGSNNKIVRFEQTFQVPGSSDLEKVTGRFEGEVLYVTVPKKAKEEEREHDKGLTDDIEERHEQAKKEEEGDERPTNDVKKKHEQAKKEEGGDERPPNDVKEKHKQAKKEEGGHKGTANGVDEKHKQRRRENDKNTGMAREGGSREEKREVWSSEAGLLGSVVEIVSRNKGILMTAVLAFSLGVLVSQKFQSNIGTEGGFSQYNHTF
ncbi:unnamed protein product [Camellia sinensis]